jgi:hypothetical protein
MEEHTEEAKVEEAAARIPVSLFPPVLSHFDGGRLCTDSDSRLCKSYRKFLSLHPPESVSFFALGSLFSTCWPPPVYAAISSLSLSLLATGIDSIFDIGSNVLLFWLHKKATRMDVNKWPVGGARLETIGNIVYGALLYH